MDGTAKHYVKWNKPVGERLIPYDLIYEGSKEQNKLMSKTEPEVRKQRTDWELPEEGGQGDTAKKVKGLVKEHVWMTHGHGHGQEYGLWEPGVSWGGLDRRGQRGNNWENCDKMNKKKKKKI